jgi:putative ABC transport system substrate-binding protein
MRRRKFLLLGGSLGLWPLIVVAQPSLPVIGFLFVGDPKRSAYWLDAWRKGVADAGLVEGRDFAADYRWGEGDPSKLPGFAADLAARRVAVIVTTSEQGLVAAMQATTSIPIVFNHISDPVGKGFVKSIPHPGGNITGIASHEMLESKLLQLLHAAMPAVSRVGYLAAQQDTEFRRRDIDAGVAAGKKLGLDVVLLTVGKVEDIDPVFVTARQRHIGAILVQSPSTFLYAQQKRILEVAARHSMPLVSCNVDFATGGGLMQYYPLESEIPELTANYVARILKGQKPAVLPVQQPTKFRLALNLKTAKALGVALPLNLINTADLVID